MSRPRETIRSAIERWGNRILTALIAMETRLSKETDDLKAEMSELKLGIATMITELHQKLDAIDELAAEKDDILMITADARDLVNTVHAALNPPMPMSDDGPADAADEPAAS